MQIHDCIVGLQVTHKDTGKVASIESISVARNEVSVVFDNGMNIKVHPRAIDPIMGSQPAAPAGSRVATRPCPNCAEHMPITAATCTACGYTYSTGAKRGMSFGVKLLLLAVAAGIGYFVYKHFAAE